MLELPKLKGSAHCFRGTLNILEPMSLFRQKSDPELWH